MHRQTDAQTSRLLGLLLEPKILLIDLYETTEEALYRKAYFDSLSWADVHRFEHIKTDREVSHNNIEKVHDLLF